MSNFSKSGKDFFLTNNIDLNNKNNNKEIIKSKKPYDDFLELASKCLGKERHYKDKVPISNSYKQLRFLMINLQTENNYEYVPSYLNNIIGQSIHNNENLNAEVKRDLKVTSKINKISLQQNDSLSFLD